MNALPLQNGTGLLLLILIQLALLMVRLSSSTGTLYSFGYDVPTTISTPSNPPDGDSNMFYLATNVIFNDSYYIVGFELYTTGSASFQAAITTWTPLSSYGIYNCWSATAAFSCASLLNCNQFIFTTELEWNDVVTFTAHSDYNYCEFTTPIQVSSGQTFQLIQSTSGASGNIFAIDSGTSASYPDTVVKSSANGLYAIEPMSSSSNARIYVRAWGYASDPGTTGTGTCLSAFALTTTTTTNPTTTFETTSVDSTMSTISTSTLSTLGPIVKFSPSELVSLISSNYTGDLSGCLVNCSSNGYCYVDPTTSKIGCACNANFTGIACSNDLRACSSSPCSNGGNCVDTIINITRSFYCECGQYYYGSLCQNIINVCANQTCSSHGSCAAVNHTATCNCFTGYLGTSCENEEQSLKVTKQIIQSTSIIAIAFIVLFYLIFVICDLHSWYVGRRRRRYNERYGRKKKNGGAHKNNSVGVGIYRVQYIN